MTEAPKPPREVEELVPLVYERLRVLARAYIRGERPGHTLTPTAIVNEAYLRLTQKKNIDWQGKTHICAMAAREMARILTDHARKKRAEKRGGDLVRVTLDEAIAPGGCDTDLFALERALEKLASLSPRQSEVVVLRFFGGMKELEVAAALGLSERTVREDWRFAKVWLRRELGGSADGA